MKARRIQGALATLVLATSLWSGAPVHAESTYEEVKISGSGFSPAREGIDLSDKYAVWINGSKEVVLYDLDKGKMTQISNNAHDKTSPVVDGNYVAWVDKGNRSTEIHLYDISKSKERVLDLASGAKPRGGEIAIHGNYVVWADDRDRESNIYAYDIKKDEEFQVSTSGKASYPTVSDSYIAWQDDGNGNPDIYYYDISRKKEKAATTNKSRQIKPHIYEDIIVYEDSRNSYGEIYKYDITLGKEEQLKLDSRIDKTMPKISGNYVAYIADDTLMYYNIRKDTTYKIDTDVYKRIAPAISSDNVLYTSQDEDGNLSLNLYNFKDDRSSGLGSGGGGRPVAPAASDNYVAYVSEGSKRNDVVLFDIRKKEPKIISTSDDEPRRVVVSDLYSVWYDDYEEALVYYDISAGKRKKLTTSNQKPMEHYFEIYGKYLFWASEDGRYYDLYLTDLSKNTTTEVSSVRNEPKSISIYGDRLLWVTENNNGKNNIYSYSIKDASDFPVVYEDIQVQSASLGDGFAVWSQKDGKYWQVWFYTFDNDRKYPLLAGSAESNQEYPQASRNMVILQDDNFGEKEYRLYNMDDRRFDRDFPAYGAVPEQVSIGGNRIVWVDKRNKSTPTLYMMAFAQPNDKPGNGGSITPGDYNLVDTVIDKSFNTILATIPYDKIVFVINPGTSKEESYTLEEGLDNVDEFIDWIGRIDLNETIIRILK